MRKQASKKPVRSSSKKVSAVRRQSAVAAAPLPHDDEEVKALALDLGKMIEAARQQVAIAANAGLTTLYWQLGRRVHTKILEGRRAEYGRRSSPCWVDN